MDSQNKLPHNWSKWRTDTSLRGVSASASKWVYVHVFSSTKECLTYLRKKGYVSKATSPHIYGKDNIMLDKAKFTDRKLAIWFGNETRGLSDEALNAYKQCIQLPMSGIVESLNLSVTTGIILYQAV